jgi:hypothetical protein
MFGLVGSQFGEAREMGVTCNEQSAVICKTYVVGREGDVDGMGATGDDVGGWVAGVETDLGKGSRGNGEGCAVGGESEAVGEWDKEGDWDDGFDGGVGKGDV